MKKIISITVLFFAMFVTSQAFAQHNSKGHTHNTGGPHGGYVEDASEGFHVEMVIKAAKLYFYLLDGNSKTVTAKDVKGDVLLQYADGTTNALALTSSGAGFTVNDSKAASFSNVIVTFQVGKKTTSAKFKANKTSKKRN